MSTDAGDLSDLGWVERALSDEQYLAVASPGVNKSILASAGSGKTRTLVHMLAADLALGVAPSQIVAFTFTEKAAGQLVARVHALSAKHFPETDVSEMYVGTIHAWCLQYLIDQSDYYNFDPIDELQLDALISRLYDSLGLESTYSQPFPRAVGKFIDDLAIFYNEYMQMDGLPVSARDTISKFVSTLKTNRLLTFGDMIREATIHLEETGPVPDLARLYIDEYQDVNPAQVALAKAMANSNARVTVVGDDLQCIYNWRGSDVTRILRFSDDFAGGRAHRLSTNYRSRPDIVTAANEVADAITLRDAGRSMVAERTGGIEASVHWHTFAGDEAEADAVAQIVESYVASGVPENRIAVLLRSVVNSGGPIVDSLESAGFNVNCSILSRGDGFILGFVIPVIEWLAASHPEPHNEAAETEAEEAATGLWDSVRLWVPDRVSEEEFWIALSTWADDIDEQKDSAYDVRGHLYDFLDTCSISVGPGDSDLMVGLGIASQVIRAVEEIHRRRIAGQSRRTPRGVMKEVYFGLLRNHEKYGQSIPVDTQTEGVLVTTVHQAKGLEWPIVILPALCQGLFPVRQRGHGTSFPDDVAARYGTSTDDERRLFYVALTRAREHLFLLDPCRDRPGKRSLFLNEVGVVDGEQPLPNDSSDVWNVSPADLQDPEPQPLHLSLSDVLIYLECPFQFGLRRASNVQPSIGQELGFGKSLHELIQRRMDSPESWTEEELESNVEGFVHLPYMSEGAEQQSKSAIRERLSALDSLRAFDQAVATEVAVTVAFEHGVIRGVIDGVATQDDGTERILDWKSNIHEGFIERYERQIQFYAWAERQRGEEVTAGELVDVAATAKTGEIVRHEVDVSTKSVDALASRVDEALKHIQLRSFPPTPGRHACASCDMYRVCRVRTELERE